MLFDSRYFWAVFTSKDSGTTERLKELVDRAGMRYVSSITLYEVFRLSLAGEGRAVAKLRTETIRKEFDVVDVDEGIAEDGAEVGHRLRIPMADALIIATAKRLRLPCVTDDPHFSEVKRVWT